jgi:hypothetical protein
MSAVVSRIRAQVTTGPAGEPTDRECGAAYFAK